MSSVSATADDYPIGSDGFLVHPSSLSSWSSSLSRKRSCSPSSFVVAPLPHHHNPSLSWNPTETATPAVVTGSGSGGGGTDSHDLLFAFDPKEDSSLLQVSPPPPTPVFSSRDTWLRPPTAGMTEWARHCQAQLDPTTSRSWSTLHITAAAADEAKNKKKSRSAQAENVPGEIPTLRAILVHMPDAISDRLTDDFLFVPRLGLNALNYYNPVHHMVTRVTTLKLMALFELDSPRMAMRLASRCGTRSQLRTRLWDAIIPILTTTAGRNDASAVVGHGGVALRR